MKKVIGRLIIILPALVLQMLWFYALFGWYRRYSAVLDAVITVFSVGILLYLIYRNIEPTYKIMWIILVILVPIFGSILFLTFGNKNSGKALEKEIAKAKEGLGKNFEPDTPAEEELKSENKLFYQNLAHLERTTGFVLAPIESAKYYSFGEEMFEDICIELEKAKEYIFLEYFIINDGIFWGKIREILAKKAKEGVDVRVMYDDLGSIALFSYSDAKKLKKLGIQCVPFNPFILILKQLNNRDHRKILVVDGKVAFTGGVNLSDEYINETHPFGRWKDIGVKVTGAPVKQFTYMFLEFWDAFAGKLPREKKQIDIHREKEILQASGQCENAENTGISREGYVLPYYDSPNRNEESSNTFYTALLSSATDYIWFYTPYLILGEKLLDAFINAAERGVDVRLILPGIPDKIIVNKIAKSYYKELADAGVKIYEYSPGFVHAKSVIVDGRLACVGSVNLDYRSLFLHFEVNTVFYKSHIIEDLRTDFLACQEECREIKHEAIKNSAPRRLMNALLRLIAPLL